MSPEWVVRGYSLQARLVIGFAALAVLTASMVGLPAVFILVQQLERQAWAQVDSGASAAQATLSARQNELNQLAILAAQRPTLEQLVLSGDQSRLETYIETLRAGADINLVLLCDPQQRRIAIAGPEDLTGLCSLQSAGGIQLDPLQADAWMLAARPFPGEVNPLGRVILGQRLDSPALERLAGQSGLEQVILQGDRVLAASAAGQASFPSREAFNRALSETPGAPGGEHIVLDLDGRPYYAIRFPDRASGLDFVAALPVSDLIEKQNTYRGYLLSCLVLAAGLGCLSGLLAARRISRPLERLGEAAGAMRKGSLDTPIPLDIPVREVHQVARTLEDTRAALQHTHKAYDLQRAWTEHLLESIVEGIVTLDHLGRVTFFSQGAERITGLQQAEVLGRRCDEIFHPVEENQRFSDFIPPPGSRSKVVLRLPDQRLVTLSISGAKLTMTTASKDRVALVLRDVSDEEGLRRLLGDFLANITHEFRTPLSALAASVELLHDQLPDLTLDETDELLNSIQLGVFGLQTLIDNLLEGASIETGQFRVFPTPTPVREIVVESVHLLEPLLQKYRQHLRIDLPPEPLFVLADARRTIQVLVNLLSNAIKNNPEEGEIKVIVRNQADFACVQVVDEGPGIPPRHLPSVFVRFVRFEASPGRSETGAGLGLSVVKAIVEAQGGEVAVQNRPERGAIFQFTMPIVEGEPHESPGG